MPTPGRRVLVLDDERLVRWSVSERLKIDGWEPVQVATVAEALEAADRGVDAAVLDVRLPDGDGLSVLRRLRQADPDIPVLMLTATKDVDVIVDAMKAGAADYVPKPFEVHDIALRLARISENSGDRRELRRLKDDLSRPYTFESLIGGSQAMQQVKSLARRVAQSPASTVLLTGESGTGKDLLAKVIHYASSRASRPFMNITCSAMPETLLESELFGHERGAFTDARQQKRGLFEQADQGTLFLDEIAETVPTLQAKLLRFLEEKAFRRVGGAADIVVDVRVIAATNRDLEQSVKDGKFREDLYFRLNVFRIRMPSLRERREDIGPIAEHFVRTYAREFRRPAPRLTPEAIRRLEAHDWPGNVRELRNVIERAVLLADGSTLTPADFDNLQTLAAQPAASSTIAPDGGIALPETGVHLDEVEKRLIELALERTRGNQTRAAGLLGLHRDQIRYRMEKYGLLKPAGS